MASASRDNDFDADLKEHFNSDMLTMLRQGSSNDVRLKLSDGEITANKDVLAARSEYFAANFRWIEETKDQSNIIEIKDCSQEVMERIIKYLFTGTIKYKNLGLLKLLELVNQVRKLLLKDELQYRIESYIRDVVLSPGSLVKVGYLNSSGLNLIRGLQYADKFVIDGVRNRILARLRCLLPYVTVNAEAISAFSTLSIQIIKELFSLPPVPRMIEHEQHIWNFAKFEYFSALYKQNEDMCQEDKEEILGMIDLDLFPPTALFKKVQPSGFFPDTEVDRRIYKYLKEMDRLGGWSV